MSTDRPLQTAVDAAELPPEQKAAGLPSGLPGAQTCGGSSTHARLITAGSTFKVCQASRGLLWPFGTFLARRSRIERKHALTCGAEGAPGRIRTCDTGFRRAVLYPLSYEG
jgi:hypothetical protein